MHMCKKTTVCLCVRTHAWACWWQGLRAPGCSECGLHGCRWSQGVFPDFPVGWMSAVCSEEPLESFIHSTNIYWTDVLIFLLWGFPFLGLPCGSCLPLPPPGRGSSAALKGAPCERCLSLMGLALQIWSSAVLWGWALIEACPAAFLPSSCLDFGSESLGLRSLPGVTQESPHLLLAPITPSCCLLSAQGGPNCA